MKRLFIAIFLLVVLVGAGAWWWVRQSVPSLDGEWRLSGLGGPVEVLHDGYGVPHVYARDTDDAWFVAGALHARDRLWQMELYRRAAHGRLSEVLGEATLPIDRRMLTLGIRAAAAAELARLGPAARTALTRYADGVNAATAALQGRQRPLELQLLGITPAPWTPEDSLAIGRLLAFRLAQNQGGELVRHALARALGQSAADALTGRYPAAAPTVLGELAETAPSPAPAVSPSSPADVPVTPAAPSVPAVPSGQAQRVSAYPPALAWLDPNAPRGNSNAWVVAGSLTSTGRPILANDPHLLIEMPSVWYELHLVAAGLDVQGVTVPGAPFVAIGHNARVAWGITNSGADVQDLVVQTFDLAGQRAQGAQGWEPVAVEAAPIPVKGRSTPVPFEVWRTSYGVVFADESLEWESPPSWLTADVPRSGQQRALVLRWEGVNGGYGDAFEAANRAGNWSDFQAAFGQLTALSLNTLYADIDGNIGYLMTGQLPQRTGSDGARPVTPGAAGRNAPLGGPGALPQLFNPSRGFLVSTNNPVLRSEVPFITRDWMGAYRAVRITGVLGAAARVSVDDTATLQLDRESGAARDVLQGLQGALARATASGGSASAVALLERLRGWDFVMGEGELPAVFAIFEDRLWRRTFADELPADLFRRYYQWAGAERPAGLYSILDQPNARWWDDIGTVERRETRDDIFLLAAADAAADLESRSGSQRRWETLHGARFGHPLGDGILLGWLFSRGPVALTGDGTTVMRVSHRRLEGFGAWEHPSWRQILDVGGWDGSRVVLPAGQSGHPMSPHHFDQNTLWRQGQYRTQAYSRAAVNGAATHRQLLTP